MPGVGPMQLPDFNGSVWDPLEILSFAAARTSRIRLGTSVVDALFHNPFILALRLVTLDRLSEKAGCSLASARAGGAGVRGCRRPDSAPRCWLVLY